MAITLEKALERYYLHKITKEELRCLLAKGVLGNITGILGPYVLRYHKGQHIISNRPFYFRMSMSEAAILGRNSFAARAKFAAFLNADPLLKLIWTLADMEGRNSWTKLCKHNHINGSAPATQNTITPKEHHFEIKQICSLEENNLIRIHNRISDGILYAILVPFDPVDKNDNPFELIKFTASADEAELHLNNDQQNICKKYKKYVLYSAVIKQNGDTIEWSNTEASEGLFDIKNGFYWIIIPFRNVERYRSTGFSLLPFPNFASPPE